MGDAVHERWGKLTATNAKRALTPFSRRPVTGFYGDAYHKAAERSPAQKIITTADSTVDPQLVRSSTFEDWAASVDRVAAALFELGIREWDAVVIVKANHPDVQVLGMAVARLGAIPIQLAWTLDGDTMSALLARAQTPWLIADGAALDRGGWSTEALHSLVRGVIVVGDEDASGDDRGVWLGQSLGSSHTAAPVKLRRWSEPMAVTHTSGTTGVPKLVMHSAESIYAMTHLETERWFGYGLRSSDTALFCDPYFHHRFLTGVLAIATSTPHTIYLSDSEDIESIVDTVGDRDPTFVEALPNMFLRWEHTLLPRHASLFAKTRVFLNSFDAIHTRTIRSFLDASGHRAPVWIQSWSQSENGPIVARPYTRRSVRKVGVLPSPTQQLGWPFPTYSRLRCVDPETKKRVRPGTPGLIEIQGPGRCIGYLGEQDRHDAKVSGRWWNTGDIGTLGVTGNVTLYDREVDSVPGASCIQIEDVLLDRLPELSEVVVLAPADADPLPVYSTRDGESISSERWNAAASKLPSRLQQPVHIQWSEFPRTATWKIQRPQLLRALTGVSPRGTGRWT